MRTALAACLALSGACSVVGPPPEYDYFVLGSARASAARSDGEKPGDGDGSGPGDVLVLGEVDLPAYLDREPMARRLGENQLVYSERDRWAEPLDAAFARVLGHELERLLRPLGVDVRPRRIGLRPDYLVRVEVLRFEPYRDERVQLWARWTIRADGQTLAAEESRVSEPMDGPGGAAAAAASTRAVQELGARIARALRGARPDR